MDEQTVENQDLHNFMDNVRGGTMAKELDAKIKDLVQCVIMHRKTGQVTLTIKVAPGKYSDNDVEVMDTITSKVPEKGKLPSLFFSADDGALLKEDPKQHTMEFESRGRSKKNNVVTIKGTK